MPKENWEGLKGDLVYTGWHLKWLGIDPQDPLPPWALRLEGFLPILVGGQARPCTFFLLKGLEGEEGFVLRHLAGVASMRLLLGAGSESWWVDRNPVHTGYTPDAIWAKGERVAIEYDAGYPKGLVLEKMYGMARRFPSQIWGAPTKGRALYLQNLTPPKLKGRIRTLHAPWC